MKKYMIVESVDTKSIKPEHVFSGVTRTTIGVTPLAPVPAILAAAGFAAAKMLHDKSITKLRTVDDLLRFTNGISYEWKHNTLYFEHPCRPHVLIEASIYKEYIVREMVADISNYITDHLNLSKLVIGLVSSAHMNLGGSIAVEEVNAEAKVKCKLDKNYIVTMYDTLSCPEQVDDYVWIKQFPDIISAVEHSAGKMEVRKKVKMDCGTTGGIGKYFNLDVGANKELEFYISYVKTA